MVEQTAAPLGTSYDCVVIGSGHGGLGAAAQLAAKGVKVASPAASCAGASNSKPPCT